MKLCYFRFLNEDTTKETVEMVKHFLNKDFSIKKRYWIVGLLDDSEISLLKLSFSDIYFLIANPQ